MKDRMGKLRHSTPIAAAALALVLASCGSGDEGSPGTQQGAGLSTQTQSAEALLAAAQKEGSLTWYTTFADDDVQPMVVEFNKKYPGIKVNALRLSADKIPARVLTEQKGGKYNADVVSGNGSYVGQLINAGALEKYSPPDAAPLPAGTDLPDGFQSYTYVTTTVIAYNPQRLKEKGLPVPTSFEDLTKPEWKGQFSINGDAINWYDSMIGTLGHEKALQLAQAMGSNSPRLVESHTQALTQVQSGEPIATAMAYGYKAADLKKKDPSSIEFVNMDPLPVGVDMIDIAKNPPHPNAAKLFVDWIVSKDGQQTMVDVTNHTSLRDDVSNDDTVWDLQKWKPAWSHATLPPATFNTYLDELQSAFKAQ